MRRAIRLAMNGRGRVEPNPMVGCVVVKDGRVIGEGWHEVYGGPHAEPNALANCTESPEGATVYVTLEPCCHTGKKTPPCAPRLVKARVGRVVVGAIDPNVAVRGRGVELLRKAGIAVTSGVLEAPCRQSVAAFHARWQENRPYVTLKWAQSADGKVAGPGGARAQISNARSMREVHRLRARCDAILVGINTVLTDDPLLTARDVEFRQPLLRGVLDRHLRIPLDCKLVRTAASAPQGSSVDPIRSNEVEVFTSEQACARDRQKVAALEERAVGLQPIEVNPDGHLSLSGCIRAIGAGRSHLLVEPGPTLARSFFETGWVDRVWLFRSPKPIADPTAPAAAAVPSHYIKVGEVALEGDVLTEYLNPRSSVFFAGEPSADLVLAEAGVR